MSPEIVKRVEFDYEKGDVWALGVVFYALVSGQFPFKGVTNRDLYNKITKGSYPIVSKFNMDIKRILCKMLEYDFKKRKTFYEISQDDWLLDKSEIDKLNEIKRRNYQLKKVYSKTKGKVVGQLEGKAHQDKKRIFNP